MLEHIVKNGETIANILEYYHVSLAELRKCNTHITDFNNLIGGTKLRIPLFHQEIEQILETTECFVADYYAKISDEIIPELIDIESHRDNCKDNKEDNRSDINNDSNVISSNSTISRDNRSDSKGIAYPGIMPPRRPYKGR